MKTTHPPGETTPTNDSMLEELQIVRSERDQAVREGKSLKQDNQASTHNMSTRNLRDNF